MLSDVARRVVPVLGRFRVAPGRLPQGPCIVAANHSSLIDPGVVLAALRRLGEPRPVVLATAGLWRIPVLGRKLRAEGHIPVQRGTAQAAAALEAAERELRRGRVVVIYPEGRLPRRPDSRDDAPQEFRTGLARLALATGAPVVPLGQAGSRRITSGSTLKQIAGVVTAPVRRPRIQVTLGPPVRLTGSVAQATAQAHMAVTEAWHAAMDALGAAQHTGSAARPQAPGASVRRRP
ncbi:lysophospholipid acyltransferase family protein [Streptacidiphilus jiangxiensis]|uniref:1-acyl-sn-glycerol-3-phosphate acyltransferases n=1 Tax=Streptacidiphilus jiangxiensis TaxID=235985 RepID=A0A1H7I4D4_STRJI|nr:lysophospholipid acyltransferase family protein [Streptacidiphilus jiangxiensis]SEK57379.1 1-acyl-sn-glycerol-3-phosphate acyltransferases [Streptacidiphilus jiangxiensis]